jgi:diguanylate cyclase (GGDEF)-like protein/PAS domain S-box-containing protein
MDGATGASERRRRDWLPRPPSPVRDGSTLLDGLPPPPTALLQRVLSAFDVPLWVLRPPPAPGGSAYRVIWAAPGTDAVRPPGNGGLPPGLLDTSQLELTVIGGLYIAAAPHPGPGALPHDALHDRPHVRPHDRPHEAPGHASVGGRRRGWADGRDGGWAARLHDTLRRIGAPLTIGRPVRDGGGRLQDVVIRWTSAAHDETGAPPIGSSLRATPLASDSDPLLETCRLTLSHGPQVLRGVPLRYAQMRGDRLLTHVDMRIEEWAGCLLASWLPARQAPTLHAPARQAPTLHAPAPKAPTLHAPAPKASAREAEPVAGQEPGRRFRLALESHPDPTAILAPIRDARGECADFQVVWGNRRYLGQGGAEVGRSLRAQAADCGSGQVLEGFLHVLRTGEALCLDAVPAPAALVGRDPAVLVDLHLSSLGDDVLITYWAASRPEKELPTGAQSEPGPMAQSEPGPMAQSEPGPMAESERGLLAAFENAPTGMFLVNLTPGRPGRIARINSVLCDLLGYQREEVLRQGLALFVLPESLQRIAGLYEAMSSGRLPRYRTETAYRAADGRLVPVLVNASVVLAGGSPVQAVVHVQDLTERRRTESELTWLALHDNVTGLANRRLLLDHTELALTRLQRRGGYVAVLHLDLNHFARINDTLGHSAGDRALVEVGRRLGRVVRAPDTTARLGSDEFVVLVPEIDGEESARALARRILQTLAEACEIDGQPVSLASSLGVAVTASTTVVPERLLHQAETAMYAGKRRGRQVEMYGPAMDRAARQRNRVEADLRQAVDTGGLRLHYQPIFDTQDGRLRGAEALLRIQHPQRGLLMPAEFVEVAEDSEHIFQIGAWAMTEACRQLALWRRRYPLDMAVNVSGRQATGLALAEQARRALDLSGADPAWLCLEITERVLIEAETQVARQLEELADAGIGIAIDDFGTGYSSLTYLQQFPVDTVKIDRSFVAGLDRHTRDSAIVAGVTDLARALDLTVVAEGVETAEQLAALRDLKCHRVQGFHLGRPLPPEQFERLLP